MPISNLRSVSLLKDFVPECPTVHHVSTHFITSHYDIGFCPVFSREDPKLGFWCPEPHFLAFWICTSLPSEVWFWKLYSAIGRNEVFILSGSSSSSPSSGMWSSMTMSDQRSVPALSSPYYQNQNPSPLWIWNNLLICTLQNCIHIYIYILAQHPFFGSPFIYCFIGILFCFTLLGKLDGPPASLALPSLPI